MSTISAYVLTTTHPQNPASPAWTFTTNVLLRLIAFCNPRKSGRHRMWNKHRVQVLVRPDWRRCGRWS
ncbi:hypothetical protein Afil01_42640 [Actinorhabdospora filicis]|uniref:Uncharacterized protein n=1 Tax=Actinorhabdospora filicis TaxID=1785913 RepID=A0A9W6SPE5_9ACTN|nr:hypothetical protein [Actinorhabdospora filicis]GLZ79457.1 hypothetical protein Afil01_42640 [Actinorhabdospora filicis]